MATATTTSNRLDVYTRVTNRIVEELENGVLPWMKPWNAEHAAGRITRPLRHNGEAYKGINILMLSIGASNDTTRWRFKRYHFSHWCLNHPKVVPFDALFFGLGPGWRFGTF